MCNMEFAIAIFVGIWVSAAGLLAYWRVKKDFDEIDKKQEERDQ